MSKEMLQIKKFKDDLQRFCNIYESNCSNKYCGEEISGIAITKKMWQKLLGKQKWEECPIEINEILKEYDLNQRLWRKLIFNIIYIIQKEKQKEREWNLRLYKDKATS